MLHIWLRIWIIIHPIHTIPFQTQHAVQQTSSHLPKLRTLRIIYSIIYFTFSLAYEATIVARHFIRAQLKRTRSEKQVLSSMDSQPWQLWSRSNSPKLKFVMCFCQCVMGVQPINIEIYICLFACMCPPLISEISNQLLVTRFRRFFS